MSKIFPLALTRLSRDLQNQTLSKDFISEEGPNIFAEFYDKVPPDQNQAGEPHLEAWTKIVGYLDPNRQLYEDPDWSELDGEVDFWE